MQNSTFAFSVLMMVFFPARFPSPFFPLSSNVQPSHSSPLRCSFLAVRLLRFLRPSCAQTSQCHSCCWLRFVPFLASCCLSSFLPRPANFPVLRSVSYMCRLASSCCPLLPSSHRSAIAAWSALRFLACNMFDEISLWSRILVFPVRFSCCSILVCSSRL